MVALAAMLSVAGTGCVDLDDARALRDRAAAVERDLRADADQLQTLLDSLPEQDPLRPEAEARLRETVAVLATVSASVERASALIAEAEDPTGPDAGPISEAVGWIAPWLPEPARAPVLLGAALAGALLRARQLREASASIVRGIDRAMKDDAAFAESFRKHAPTFRSTQTPLAQRIVDRTAGRPGAAIAPAALPQTARSVG